MSKDNVAGYRVLDKKTREVVDELVGTQKRSVLNKYRKAGNIVKKLTFPAFH